MYKFKPSLEPSVCPLELDMMFVSDAIATSSTCVGAATSVCSCTSSVTGLSGEGTWSLSSVTSVNRGSKVKENSLNNKRKKNPPFKLTIMMSFNYIGCIKLIDSDHVENESRT